MDYFYWAVVIVGGGFLISASFTSFVYRERRAGYIFLLLAVFWSSLLTIPLTGIPEPNHFQILMLSFTGLFALAFFLPYSHATKRSRGFGNRFHEADSVLSRRRLVPGTKAYQAYYDAHPQFREPDDRARSNPGLLSPGSHYYDPVTFAAAKANFEITEHLHQLNNFPVNERKTEHDPIRITRFIRDWLIRSGAKDVGFTALKEHHLYTHKGRGARRGAPIMNDHPHAIAIIVEMDPERMQYAPAGPTVMESANCYLSSGTMATRLALMIRELGFEAKAHIDGDYEVICPLVAADAGLGEIGRMGLLMTPNQGPRIRIAVVTTDLSVSYSKPASDPTMEDFCRRCKKCARVCPSAAIPFGDMEEAEGSRRWRINADKCYHYWTVSGTDCGRCVISCPYSHPNHWLHRFSRQAIKNNLLFRVMAVKFDNVFYGRKPGIKTVPDHLSFTTHK